MKANFLTMLGMLLIAAVLGWVIPGESHERDHEARAAGPTTRPSDAAAVGDTRRPSAVANRNAPKGAMGLEQEAARWRERVAIALASMQSALLVMSRARRRGDRYRPCGVCAYLMTMGLLLLILGASLVCVLPEVGYWCARVALWVSGVGHIVMLLVGSVNAQRP